MFRRALALALVGLLGLASPAVARGHGGGGHSYHSSFHVSSHSFVSVRPYYGGGHHTTSHGGHYAGGHGSSHKGGHYVNPRTGNHYGRHK